jgi:hypothetical protein
MSMGTWRVRVCRSGGTCEAGANMPLPMDLARLAPHQASSLPGTDSGKGSGVA